MKRKTITSAALVVLVLSLSVGGLAGGAIAQTNTTAEDEAPIYENSTEPDTDTWMDGIQPDLPGVVTLAGRVGTFIVGGGGSGVNGSLLTGVLVLGLGLGTVARSGVGSIAGGTLAVAGVFAGASTGIAPQWISGVLMFAIGLVLASVFRRVLN